MSVLKTLYPAASSVAIGLTFASLASDANTNIGRASDAVDNTSNLDLDHLLSGVVRTGTSPTVATQIEVYVYAPILLASGVPTYPDGITGSDAAKTMTSINVKVNALRIAAVMIVDNTSNRDYAFAPVSVASLFGGALPPFWGVFIAHSTAVALNATQVALQYFRVQGQTT